MTGEDLKQDRSYELPFLYNPSLTNEGKERYKKLNVQLKYKARKKIKHVILYTKLKGIKIILIAFRFT